MRTARQAGFTLIELMIVVAVVAILAMIALPAYTEQIRKGKRAEAVRAIGEFQLSLERWRAECSSYADLTACKDFDGDGTVESGEGTYPAAPLSDYYTIAPSNQGAAAYTITATRKNEMAGDTGCGNFTMVVTNGVPTKGVTGSKGVDYCWRR